MTEKHTEISKRKQKFGWEVNDAVIEATGRVSAPIKAKPYKSIIKMEKFGGN